ncbi:hypothetical protein HY251_12785 [bacterium]|nr:hypothetical protein [bacterium]
MPESAPRDTLKTGAGWKAAVLKPRDRARVSLLPVRVGPHLVAIEAMRIIAVFPGAVYVGEDDPKKPVRRVDLHGILGVSGTQSCETIVARADDRTGRGDGPRVAFAIDGAERLVTLPLEALGPFPPVAREQIQVDFLVGVVNEPDRTSFLLDPARLSRWAAALEAGRARGAEEDARGR